MGVRGAKVGTYDLGKLFEGVQRDWKEVVGRRSPLEKRHLQTASAEVLDEHKSSYKAHFGIRESHKYPIRTIDLGGKRADAGKRSNGSMNSSGQDVVQDGARGLWRIE